MLLHHFLMQASAAHRQPVPRLTTAIEQRLLAYPWPGNVRELKNVTERLVVQQIEGPLTIDHLPIEMRDAPTAHSAGVAAPAVAMATPPVGAPAASLADQLWMRLLAGDNFWTVVHQPFKAHDLTRADLRAVIARGLQHTRGSYRQLVADLRLPPSDYKRVPGVPVPVRTATCRFSGTAARRLAMR